MITFLTGDLRTKSVREAGFDTVGLRYRVAGSDLISCLLDQDGRPSHRGSWLVSEPLRNSGARLMAYPEQGIVKVEGRLAALATDDHECHDLATREQLADADATVAELLRSRYGVDLKTTGEVARCDMATERRFDDPAEGLALLRGVSALSPPARKRNVWYATDGTVETAYQTTKKGVVKSRIYDKGVESGSDLPGQRIRLEAQSRFSKGAAYEPAIMAKLDLRSMVAGKLAAYLDYAPEVAVASLQKAPDVIVEKVAAGELSETRAERMIGSMVILERYGRAFYGDDYKSARRLLALRRAGVAIDEQLPRDAVVPVGQLLREMIGEFSTV